MEGWNKLIIPIVGITVSIICLATILMPVLDDATATTATFNNDGYFNMKEYTGDNIIYGAKWDHTTPSSIIVNDVTINITEEANGTSLILDGNFFLRYYTNNPRVILYYGNQSIVEATVANGTDMIITYNAGNMIFTNTAETPVSRTIPVDVFYSISTTGDYVMKKSTQSAYMTKDSLIYGCGRTTASNNEILGTLVSGNLEQVNVTIWRGDFTPSDIAINKTPVAGYIGLSKFDSVTFKAISTIDDTVTNVTYSYVVVPASVTVELSDHLDKGPVNVLLAIPVMVILVILMAAASMIMRNRE